MKKIIDYLELTGLIHCESVGYNIPKTGYPAYPFSYEEFKDFIHQKFDEADGTDEKYDVVGSYFPTSIIPFFFEGKEYRLVVMSGQGTVYTLCTVTECEQWMERNRLLDLEDED